MDYLHQNLHFSIPYSRNVPVTAELQQMLGIIDQFSIDAMEQRYPALAALALNDDIYDEVDMYSAFLFGHTFELSHQEFLLAYTWESARRRELNPIIHSTLVDMGHIDAGEGCVVVPFVYCKDFFRFSLNQQYFIFCLSQFELVTDLSLFLRSYAMDFANIYHASKEVLEELQDDYHDQAAEYVNHSPDYSVDEAVLTVANEFLQLEVIGKKFEENHLLVIIDPPIEFDLTWIFPIADKLEVAVYSDAYISSDNPYINSKIELSPLMWAEQRPRVCHAEIVIDFRQDLEETCMWEAACYMSLYRAAMIIVTGDVGELEGVGLRPLMDRTVPFRLRKTVCLWSGDYAIPPRLFRSEAYRYNYSPYSQIDKYLDDMSHIAGMSKCSLISALSQDQINLEEWPYSSSKWVEPTDHGFMVSGHRRKGTSDQYLKPVLRVIRFIKSIKIRMGQNRCHITTQSRSPHSTNRICVSGRAYGDDILIPVVGYVGSKYRKVAGPTTIVEKSRLKLNMLQITAMSPRFDTCNTCNSNQPHALQDIAMCTPFKTAVCPNCLSRVKMYLNVPRIKGYSRFCAPYYRATGVLENAARNAAYIAQGNIRLLSIVTTAIRLRSAGLMRANALKSLIQGKYDDNVSLIVPLVRLALSKKKFTVLCSLDTVISQAKDLNYENYARSIKLGHG